MNGYSLTEKLKKTKRKVKLSVYEQALYHQLVCICNEKKWPEVFQCSNKRLCKELNITEPTLFKTREILIKAELIYYQSGKSARKISSYSFIKSFTEKVDTTGIADFTTKDNLTDATKQNLAVTTQPDLDYNIINIDNKTPSIISHESERKFSDNLLTISEIKSRLLADEKWKEKIILQSGMDLKFRVILPEQIENFLQYICAIGEEQTVQTLSDAKRRFYYWWKKYGKMQYENDPDKPEIIVW